MKTFSMALMALLITSSVALAQQVADIVAINGKIYTVNDKQPWSEAIAIKGRDIVYVGDNEGAKAFMEKRKANFQGK